MKRWVLYAVLLAGVVATAAGYFAIRRDDQYRTFIAVGEQAVRDDDALGAIEAFSGAIALRPSSMLGWLKRGEVYMRRGDYRSALRDLRQAVTLDPAALRPRELLGDAQVALDRFSRAADDYESYLELDDRDARVAYKLGLARLRAGALDRATTALTRAVRLDDRMPEAHYVLGVCLAQQNRNRDAIAALERAVALAPAMIDAREVLASRYRRAGRTNDEVRQLEAITALDPNRPDRHVAVADAWTHAGRHDLAVTTLVRAIERFPDASELLAALGRVWLDVAETRHESVALGKALEALHRAAARSPSAPTMALLGRAQLRNREFAAALRSLQQATSSLPMDPRALHDLADAAERVGRVAIARDALVKEAALVGDGQTPRARADRAMRIAALAERLGDKAQAVAWLERAAAAVPDDRAIAARLASVRPRS